MKRSDVRKKCPNEFVSFTPLGELLQIYFIHKVNGFHILMGLFALDPSATILLTDKARDFCGVS